MLNDPHRGSERRIQAHECRPTLGYLHKQHAAGSVAIDEGPVAEGFLKLIEVEQFERALQILVAVRLDRMAIENGVHVRDTAMVLIRNASERLGRTLEQASP